MTKKLLLLCAVIVMCVGRISAQSEEPVWCLVTENTSMQVSEVAYILCVDDAQEFSIVKTNNEVVSGVRTIHVRTLASVKNVETTRFDVSVFPNPVVSQLNLKGLQGNATARVLSLDGATLIETEMNGNGTIDVSTLPTGIYLLQVEGTTVKFIKK